MKWNLRLAAAHREIWKASQLQGMLAQAGLVVSAGKMSHLWAGQPVTIRLDDLEIICTVLGCTPNDLLVVEQRAAPPAANEAGERAAAAAGGHPIQRRHTGRISPPV
ncbi:MAG: helix-turn-helix transcriptional regulator [Pseudonocardiaceae bacterium]